LYSGLPPNISIGSARDNSLKKEAADTPTMNLSGNKMKAVMNSTTGSLKPPKSGIRNSIEMDSAN